MSCFPCFSSGEKKELKRRNSSKEASVTSPRDGAATPPPVQEKPDNHHKPVKQAGKTEEKKNSDNGNIQARTFTFRELAAATNNFRPENLLGEGGFGRVYKGNIDNDSQAVAVKQLDRNGLQGNKEFLVEVLMLSLLHHENLVNLVGYCADGDQRLLVYEFMPLGSLEEHLFDIGPDQKPLDWNTRMRIATGAAQGLEYLHDKANPPVIYRDLKSSNILLDKGFNPKLSDFGLAKLGPVGDKIHVSSRVMGTYGYCAPEYARSGQLTLKSDVYSFGVVLLELITGRSAIDTTRPPEEQNLVAWAQPYFKNPKRFPELADPRLQGHLQTRSLNQAVAVAAMCLQEEATVRPLMADVVAALSFLSIDPPDAGVTSTPVPASVVLSPPPEEKMLSDVPSPEEKMLSDDPPAGEETSSDDDSHKNEKISNHDPFSEPEASNDDDQSQDEEGTETIQLGSYEEAAIAEATGSDSDSD